MQISLSITDFSWSSGPAELADELSEVVAVADEGGLDTVWVSDHLIQADPNSTPDSEMLEAYTALGFLAARTQRIRLGAMVTPATFRQPALLIKAVTTLDVLSRGRAWLGLGAGYLEDEAAAMGLFLPPVAERFERLEETLQIADQMWSDDRAAFDGKHYRLGRPTNSPGPISRPHPPVLIGGMGEQKTLRLVAQYADACNLFDIPDGGKTIAHKLEVLAQHCKSAGRSFDTVEKTVSTRLEPGETAEQFAERCRSLTALGLDHAVVITTGPWTKPAVATLVASAAILEGAGG